MRGKRKGPAARRRTPRDIRRAALLAIAGVTAVALLNGVGYLVRIANCRRALDALQAPDVDLASVADGEYTGTFHADLIKARVRISVRDHTMVEVELLEYRSDRGGAADALVERILAEQRVDVDAVTGATASSKVIMEAARKALAGGQAAPR